MTALLLIAAFALQPALGEPLEDRCDVAEVNHFYDESGRLVFDQVIFYDWCDAAGRHQVRAWRLAKHPNQLPQRDWTRGGYVAVWQDGEVLRVVRSAGYRESWTQYDPELVERNYLPTDQRRELKTLPRQ